MKRFILFVTLSLLCIPVMALALDIEPVICTGIDNRMPTGEGTTFDSGVERVYLWTKVTGANEETSIRHVWLYNGKEMADVTLPVKGSPWRTYSYKTMLPEWAGKWDVKIVGPDGNVITSVSFEITDKTKAEKKESVKSDIEVSPSVKSKAVKTAVDSTGKK